MQTELRKPAVDLTDLAIGIVVLGIVVSVGATILINVRDTNTAQGTAYNVANSAATGLAEYGNWWDYGVVTNSPSPLKEQSFNALTRISVKILNEGQDRSVKHKIYALTTDKGNSMSLIYSLDSYNI